MCWVITSAVGIDTVWCMCTAVEVLSSDIGLDKGAGVAMVQSGFLALSEIG